MQLKRNSTREDNQHIAIKDFSRVLAKYRLKLSEKQSNMIQKLYKVNYRGDVNVISIEPLYELEK